MVECRSMAAGKGSEPSVAVRTDPAELAWKLNSPRRLVVENSFGDEVVLPSYKAARTRVSPEGFKEALPVPEYPGKRLFQSTLPPGEIWAVM